MTSVTVLFEGPQATGKTTTAKYLKELLWKSFGENISMLDIGYENFASKLCDVILSKMSLMRWYVRSDGFKWRIFLRKEFVVLWLLSHVAGLVPYGIYLAFIVYIKRPRVLILERYAFDYLVHMILDSMNWHLTENRRLRIVMSILMRLVYGLIPRKSLLVLLHCRHKELLLRYTKSGKRKEPLDYVVRQQLIGHTLLKTVGAMKSLVIDTTQLKPYEVAKRVFNELLYIKSEG